MARGSAMTEPSLSALLQPAGAGGREGGEGFQMDRLSDHFIQSGPAGFSLLLSRKSNRVELVFKLIGRAPYPPPPFTTLFYHPFIVLFS